MATQRFEYGLMIWMQFDDRILVLYQDSYSPHWQWLSNAWFEGMQESDPSIVPPPGYFQPIRGFGKAWREETEVRDRLGWAIEKEYLLENAVFQCDSAPKYAQCYVTGPNNVVYTLKPERSGWFLWTGPTPTP
jgi:hypothetical protein